MLRQCSLSFSLVRRREREGEKERKREREREGMSKLTSVLSSSFSLSFPGRFFNQEEKEGEKRVVLRI